MEEKQKRMEFLLQREKDMELNFMIANRSNYKMSVILLDPCAEGQSGTLMRYRQSTDTTSVVLKVLSAI